MLKLNLLLGWFKERDGPVDCLRRLWSAALWCYWRRLLAGNSGLYVSRWAMNGSLGIKTRNLGIPTVYGRNTQLLLYQLWAFYRRFRRWPWCHVVRTACPPLRSGGSGSPQTQRYRPRQFCYREHMMNTKRTHCLINTHRNKFELVKVGLISIEYVSRCSSSRVPPD